MLSTPRIMLNLAHNLNKQYLYGEAEKIALEVKSLLEAHNIYAIRVVERIKSLKIVFFSQFSQGKAQAAEINIRAVIRLIVHYWGTRHSWVTKFICVLEVWLRG